VTARYDIGRTADHWLSAYRTVLNGRAMWSCHRWWWGLMPKSGTAF